MDESEKWCQCRSGLFNGHRFQNWSDIYVSLWETEPTSPLFYSLSEQFPDEFMVSNSSLKSSSSPHHVHSVDYGPI